MANDGRDSDLSVLEAGAQNAMLKPKGARAGVAILGVRLCRRRKTDAEYIASVRKMVSRPGRMRAMCAVSAALYFAILFMIWHAVFEVAPDRLPEEVTKGNGLGLTLGLGIGAVMGFLLMQAMSNLIQVFTITQGQRTERLMLKFHDAFQSSEQSAAPADSVDQP